jgi:hypothetical protein
MLFGGGGGITRHNQYRDYLEPSFINDELDMIWMEDVMVYSS